MDGNLRRKDQTIFSSLFGFDTSDVRMLTTGSVTPRANITTQWFGVPSKITTGFDYYNSSLNAKRSMELSDPPYHTYDLNQQSVAVYWQQTIAVLPTTDISFGARLQQTRLTARDLYDPTAPGGAFDAQAIPLDSTETQYALHLGFEHRFSPMFAVFGRVARSFRTPNVDERIGVNAFPVDFNLKTQTSRDIEGGARGRFGMLEWQSSVYEMQLNNEILFIPFPPIGADINLDPTRRFGVENSATLRLSDTVRVKGGLTYTRATFRDGMYAGNDIPLVSRWTGNLGVYLEYLQETRCVRRGGALRRRAAHGQRPGQFPATDSGAHHGGRRARRRISEFLLVGFGAEPVQCFLLRLCRRQFRNVRPLQCLSVGGTDLHGEGRREILKARRARRLRDLC